MRYDMRSTLDVGLSVGHFSTGIAIFSIPYMIQTMSLSVYIVLQLVSLAINIYLVFNILSLQNPKKSLQKTLYSNKKTYGVLYFIFSFWVLIPLTPVAAIVSICMMNIKNVQKWQILLPAALIIYLLSHLRQSILFKLVHFCIPGFWLLVIFILFDVGQDNKKVPINWVPQDSVSSFQYSFIFFSTLAQTYAHDYLIVNRQSERAINLRISFAVALFYNALLTFIFGVVGAVYGEQNGNILEHVKFSPFYAFLQTIYAVQLVFISAILLQKYQPYPGSAKLGRMKLQYQRHSDNAMLLEPARNLANQEQQLANNDQECSVQEDQVKIKELTAKEIALNEICPVGALIVVFLLSIFTQVNISITINFCSNFGGLFVCTVPGIVLSPKEYRFKNGIRIIIIVLLTAWSTACSVTQLVQSIKSL